MLEGGIMEVEKEGNMKKQRHANDYMAVAIEARRNSGDAEKKLWEELSGNKLAGCHFRRKHWIEDYLIDFCCLTRKLAIFVEGSNMDEQQYQAEAMAACMANGFRVVTFRKSDILHNLAHVMKTIELLVKLDSAGLKKERQIDKKMQKVDQFRKRDRLRSDVDYLRGHPANADSSTLKIIRILKK